MIKPIIHSIFPIPVYTIKIDREFTKQELQFVNDQKKHCLKNNMTPSNLEAKLVDQLDLAPKMQVVKIKRNLIFQMNVKWKC